MPASAPMPTTNGLPRALQQGFGEDVAFRFPLLSQVLCLKGMCILIPASRWSFMLQLCTRKPQPCINLCVPQLPLLLALNCQFLPLDPGELMAWRFVHLFTQWSWSPIKHRLMLPVNTPKNSCILNWHGLSEMRPRPTQEWILYSELTLQDTDETKTHGLQVCMMADVCLCLEWSKPHNFVVSVAGPKKHGLLQELGHLCASIFQGDVWITVHLCTSCGWSPHCTHSKSTSPHHLYLNVMPFFLGELCNFQSRLNSLHKLRAPISSL